MADESLLELERVLRGAPDDAATRHRLVALLARSGRRREALDHARLLPDARAITNEIWRDELERLERTVAVPGAHEVTDVALDPSGELLAWSSNRDGFHVASVRTGERIHSAAGQRQDRLFAVPGKVYCDDRPRGVITAVEATTPGGEARVTRRTAPGVLLDVSPAGDLVLLEGTQVHGVYTWPALGAVLEHPSRLHPPVVDWETRRVLVNGLHGLEVHPFVGVVPPPLAGRTRVPPVVLGGVPVRFELDLATGDVLARPERVERLALAQTREDSPTEVFWHPHADLVLQRRRGGPFELRTLEGASVMRLPPASAPQGWTRDGRALLVLRGAGEEGRVFLELWRVP